MLADLFGSRTDALLKGGLKALYLRQKALAHNVANVNTPGYKRTEVTFADAFRRALSRGDRVFLQPTHPSHFAPGTPNENRLQPNIRKVRATSLRADGNNVDIERELTEMAQNYIHYQAVAQQVSERYETLNRIIREGGR